jgi:hypothetical protein
MKFPSVFLSLLLFAGNVSAGMLPSGGDTSLPGSGGSTTLPGGSGSGGSLPPSGGGAGLPSAPPVTGGGDMFASATRLSGTTITETGNNSAATKEVGEPNHGGYAGNPGGKSLWWRWTSGSDGLLTISTAGSSFDTVVAVYTGTDVAELTTIGHDDNSGPGQASQLTVRVLPESVYYIAVDGYNGTSGDVQLSLSVEPTELSTDGRPVNDNFENRISVSGSFTINYGSNQEATVEAGEVQITGAAFLVGQSVWYSWTAPSDGTVTIDTNGSNYDTSLTIYQGTEISDLIRLAQDDDGGAANLDSLVELTVFAGETYHIAVDGYSGNITGRSSGSFILNINLIPREALPDNDTFDFRTGIQGESYTDGADNEKATFEDDEPLHADSLSGRTLWWTWTAPNEIGTLILKTVADEDAEAFFSIGVYTGQTLAALAEVGSADDADDGDEDGTTTVEITTVPGMTYQIAVTGGVFDDKGGFDFSLNYADGSPAFESQPVSLNVELGTDAVFTAPATDTTVAPFIYQWQRKVGSAWVNLSDDATFTGSNTEELTVNDVTLGLSNSRFRCQIYNVVGVATSAEVTLVVVPNAPADLGGALIIKKGTLVNETVFTPNPVFTVKYVAFGLPKGLKINPTTGQITGTITAPAGSYTVTYWTQSGSLKSQIRTTVITVPVFPVLLSGNFEALLADGDGIPVGKLQVTISDPGQYTGKFTSGAATVNAIKGSMALSVDDTSATGSAQLKRKGFPTSQLSFTVNDDGTIDATLMQGMTPLGTAVDGVKVATSDILWNGTYTMAFAAPVTVNPDVRPIPEGSGYAAMKIAANGVMTLTGKNADGTPLTASLASAADASYRLYAKPSTVVGSYVGGWIQLTERVGEPGVYHGVEADNGDLYWALGASSKSAAYKAGFGPLLMTARVEPWENLFAPFQIDPTDDDLDTSDDWDGIFGVDIFGAGITNGGGNTNNLPESLRLLVGGTIGLTTPNLSGWSISVNTTTGVFTGSFTVTDTLTRKVSFSGILLQLASDDATGGLFGQGYFLLPSTVKKGPALSGAVEFVAPVMP